MNLEGGPKIYPASISTWFCMLGGGLNYLLYRSEPRQPFEEPRPLCTGTYAKASSHLVSPAWATQAAWSQARYRVPYLSLLDFAGPVSSRLQETGHPSLWDYFPAASTVY